MSKNKQQEPQQTLKVENYEFEPIKGYPMLNWKGKRPFTSTQYFPAQLKESYGKPDANGWMNKIFWGDNLQVMSHLLKEYRGKVDLIYIDPPFDSNADYKKKINLKGNRLTNDHSLFEEKQYSDIWSNDDYLQFIYDRLILLRELLSDVGSIFVHCDSHHSHHIRCILDEVFGNGGIDFKGPGFKNEIVWKRTAAHSNAKQGAKYFGRQHDVIFFYTKTAEYKWNQQYRPYDKEYVETNYRMVDESGRRFQAVDMTAAKPGGDTNYEWKGYRLKSGKYWAYSKEKMKKFDEEGKIYYTKNGLPRLKYYLDEMPGIPLQDMWDDFKNISSQSDEREDYPTQKPEILIERIILNTTNPGDLVFDCFSGSGTTAVVANKLGRKYIIADINAGAVSTSVKRLCRDIKLNSEVGFEYFNVNNFDLFRNPTEAREIILKILEIDRLNRSIFDGEKDGRLVKLMPVNRIASKADLGDIIAGMDYKLYEKRQKEHPTKAVEKILLVCMGHEPDLKAHLEKEVNYKLDVEIVDILRDKQDLQFKRESEAKIKIKKDKLFVEKFYPLNLLQKLSLQKEKVSDWKELVESVLIDWNYDGAVLEPQVIDIPEKNELVAGEYDVPKDAGTIRVKITDLLSESIEIEVGRE